MPENMQTQQSLPTMHKERDHILTREQRHECQSQPVEPPPHIPWRTIKQLQQRVMPLKSKASHHSTFLNQIQITSPMMTVTHATLQTQNAEWH